MPAPVRRTPGSPSLPVGAVAVRGNSGTATTTQRDSVAVTGHQFALTVEQLSRPPYQQGGRPCTLGISRLAGAPKAALVDVQADEYGGGRAEMHSALFARTMQALGVDAGYAVHLDRVPTVTLASVERHSHQHPRQLGVLLPAWMPPRRRVHPPMHNGHPPHVIELVRG